MCAHRAQLDGVSMKDIPLELLLAVARELVDSEVEEDAYGIPSFKEDQAALSDLKSLSLTCSAFRHPAQECLFSHATVHLGLQIVLDSKTKYSQSQLLWESFFWTAESYKRLQLRARPRFAQLIKRCSISRRGADVKWLQDVGEPGPLLMGSYCETLLRALQLMPKLWHLAFDELPVPVAVLRSICAECTSLTSVKLDSCPLIGIQDIPLDAPRITKLVIPELALAPRPSLAKVLNAIVHPSDTKSLQIFCNVMMNAERRYTDAQTVERDLTIFHGIVELVLGAGEVCTLLFSLVGHCLNLQTLSMPGVRTRALPNIPAESCPYLTFVSGNAEQVLDRDILDSLPTVRHVGALDNNYSWTDDNLRKTLGILDTPLPQIVSLFYDTEILTSNMLRDIWENLPSLRLLHIRHSYVGPRFGCSMKDDLLPALREHKFPGSLEYLSIDRQGREYCREDVIDAIHSRRDRCPVLQYVVIGNQRQRDAFPPFNPHGDPGEVLSLISPLDYIGAPTWWYASA